MNGRQIVRVLVDERRDRGWTQEQVAEKAGVKQCTVSDWENGKYMPGLDSLIAWASAFGWAFELVGGAR